MNVSLLYVSYVHAFYGGTQMYVESKVVHIDVKGVPVIGRLRCMFRDPLSVNM